jgi:hypothetical protein
MISVDFGQPFAALCNTVVDQNKLILILFFKAGKLAINFLNRKETHFSNQKVFSKNNNNSIIISYNIN